MQLTQEQMASLKSGESIRLQEDGTELVVLRADVFERIGGLPYYDEPWSADQPDILSAEDTGCPGWEIELTDDIDIDG
jgi:hypothetical protein